MPAATAGAGRCTYFILDTNIRATYFLRRMTLETYLKEHGLTDAAFGARVNLSQSYVSRLRRGKENPTADALARIYEGTAGAVTPNDLLGMKPAERASEARQ